MARDISLDIRGSEIAKKLNRIRASALYVAARAINDTAFGLKESLEKHVSRRLEIKNKAYNRFLVEKASKVYPEALVYHRFGTFGLHQKGGIQTPEKKYIAVPAKAIQHKRGRALHRILVQSYQKRAGKPPVFFTQESRSGKLQIYKRTKKGGYPIVPQFILTEKAKYRKRISAYAVAEAYVKANMPKFFNKYIRQVMNERR